MSVLLQADSDRVLAFRLASHNLSKRLPPGSLLEAAAACGLQNSPPGSAALALNARVSKLTPAEIDRAIEVDKSLIQTRSLRTAPHIFPTRDLRVFTTGLLPSGEESLRFFILGSNRALDLVEISATEIVERTAIELLEVLDGRILTFRQLSAELTERVARRLSPEQLAHWRSPSWYGPNQCLGEAIVHFTLYAISLEGLFCFAPRKGNEASFVRTDQWLGKPQAEVEPDRARAELVRRYLRCNGPTTVGHFARWAGISPAAAGHTWRLIEPELVEVSFDGRRVWLHEQDIEDFGSPPRPEGLRLLPPHDPYLSQIDRETLLPDKALQRRVWKTVGNPGVVLAEGRVVATWRPQKKGKRLKITIEPFVALTEQIRADIESEAELLASFKGNESVEVLFAS
jgi:hypothetical protein